jgi:hypothetical protein
LKALVYRLAEGIAQEHADVLLWRTKVFVDAEHALDCLAHTLEGILERDHLELRCRPPGRQRPCSPVSRKTRKRSAK